MKNGNQTAVFRHFTSGLNWPFAAGDKAQLLDATIAGRCIPFSSPGRLRTLKA